jgi:hypothetical protein
MLDISKNLHFMNILFFSMHFVLKRTGRTLTQAVLTFVLCFSTSAQDWKTVADGVEHAQVRREFSGKPVNLNLLRLDLKKVRLDVHHAMDAAIGTEKTSSIATRHGALAAINAGFFRLDTSIWAGDSAGALVIDTQPVSESISPRIALGIANRLTDTIVSFGTFEQTIAIRLGVLTRKIAGINRERKADEAIVFTPWFPRTTLTDSNGIEICAARGKVTRIARSGSSRTADCQFVVSASGTMIGEFERVKVGENASLNYSHFVIDNPHAGLPYAAEDVVAGVPQLIRDSKIDITWQQEKASRSFVETRHPRTAVAKLKDGRFLMLTADGRTEESAGLDLYDLAAYMLELGATDAMNLDGGGSTTMFLNGTVINKPSDKEGERKVGDAILVTLRRKK